MVYKYKRKMDRGSSWTEASMSAALEAIKSTTSPMGIREAAREFDIPYATLHKHVNQNSSKKAKLDQVLKFKFLTILA